MVAVFIFLKAKDSLFIKAELLHDVYKNDVTYVLIYLWEMLLKYIYTLVLLSFFKQEKSTRCTIVKTNFDFFLVIFQSFG